jgi:hypothetical protein
MFPKLPQNGGRSACIDAIKSKKGSSKLFCFEVK